MTARRWVLVLLPPLVVVLSIAAARATSGAERTLAMDQADAARVVTHVLETGLPLRVPIEVNTDVLRVVVHVFHQNSLSPRPHPAVLSATFRGARREWSERLELALPGTATRATAEDRGIVVGDPVALNFDVRDARGGDLTLALVSLQDADGLLVRAYRRESTGLLDAFRRRAGLGQARREHLARRAGAADWLDLDSDARATLESARWRKMAALAETERGIASKALTLAPRQAAATPEGGPVSQLDLRCDERVGGMVTGPAVVIARGDPTSRLTLSVSEQAGETRTIGSVGAVRLEAKTGQTLRFDLATSSPQVVRFYVSDPERLSLGSAVTYFRATPNRPAVVAAGGEPLVLRVSARRAIERTLSDDVPILVNVSIQTLSRATVKSTFGARVGRSRYDRYDPPNVADAPSERAVFYVLVPARGRATLQPDGGSVDLSFAELDPRAPPREAGAPTGIEPEWTVPGGRPSAFAFRRPTNAGDFGLDEQGLVRVGHRPAARSAVSVEPHPTRVVRPPSAGAIHRSGKTFEPAAVPLTVRASGQRPFFIPARLFASEPVNVVALIDGGHPRRREAGIALHLTSAHAIAVDGETKVPILVGDDLDPGLHALTFEAASRVPVWVHLPWARKGLRARGSTWIAGDFGP